MTRCVGESGVTQLGMRGLEGLQLLEQRVVVGVGDLGRVEYVVGACVMLERRAQRRARVRIRLRRGHASAANAPLPASAGNRTHRDAWQLTATRVS